MLLATLAFAALAGCAASSQDEDPTRGLRLLTGTQTLPRSHGTFAVPHDASLVVGSDAKVLNDRVMDGSSDSEAVLLDGPRTTYIGYFDIGFIRSDDWSRMKPQILLSEIREATNAGNPARSQAGLPTIDVDQWITRPRFDAKRSVASCMYAIHDSRGVYGENAVALVLGRSGYEMFSMFGVDPSVDADRQAFAKYLGGFNFPAGRTYKDHATYDKRSAFDILAAFRVESGGGK